MTVLEIKDKETVAIWLLDSESTFKAQLLRDWMNDRLLAVAFTTDSIQCGWAVYYYTFDDYLNISYLEMWDKGIIRQFHKEWEDYAVKKREGLKGLRFQTARSGKLWERLWPGFKIKYTILEKQIGG
jgi:hypothetical protein